MCIFGKIFNKMATKQYLDAETIPYQVILREADGSYIDQYPQSFYVSREGNGFHANGGTGAHFLKRDFSAIDWKSCLPIPDPIPTDTEGYMAYLSVLFTGQLGTLVPPTPTPTMQSIFSQSFILDATANGAYINSIVGTAQLDLDVNIAGLPLERGTLNNFLVEVAPGLNSCDVNIPFDVYYDGAVIGSGQIDATTDGGIAASIATPTLGTKSGKMYILFTVPLGTGTCRVAGCRTDITFDS